MAARTVRVPGIRCGHCTATIERELGEIDGVVSAEGDPESKQVQIRWESPATWDEIEATLVDIGFAPEEMGSGA